MKLDRLLSLALIFLSSFGTVRTSAQELPPNDASISNNLQLWLRDAASNFDEGTGVWSDSSGKGHDAETIGEVNVNAAQTFVAPTLVTTSGGSFSTSEVPAVHFAADVNDLLGTPGLNGDAGMDNLTIFAVYNITNLGGTSNLTRPVGIGSISATQANPGNHVNLSSDPSIRKDNGQIGSGQYALPFPAETLLIRTVRLTPEAIDDWFNTDGTVTNVLNVPGASYTTSVDRFYLGDLRGGNDPVPGFGGATARSDFDIVQVLVYNSALSDAQVAGVNAWLAGNLVPKSRLKITEISHESVSGELTIGWESAEGLLYNLRSATDPSSEPSTWEIFGDKADLPATPPLNTLAFSLPAEAARFFVVESFPAPPVTIFSDDFENGAGAWTTGFDDANGTTLWELGTPTVVGPSAAHSPVNCFGTNLAANYEELADIWLRSPPIDLTGAAQATLKFFHFTQIEPMFDLGILRVLDASDDSLLAEIGAPIDGDTSDWEEVSRSLPAAALGNTIKLEFRFNSDDFMFFAGWYIDDVEVTVP